jgi:ornithine decarboxylase
MEDTIKSLDSSLIKKHDVKIYKSDCDTHDIINDILEENQSERAFYIVDIGEVMHAFRTWVHLLPNIQPYYAVKCNSNHVLLETLSSLGVNFDCASENEIKQIIEITQDPSRIIFANPCKMISHIRYAKANDVDTMTFDCEEELHKIRSYHPNAKLVLRLAVDDTQSECGFNKKFGCKLKDAKSLLTLSKELSLNVVGFSFHVGTKCKTGKSFYKALFDTRNIYDVALEVGFKPVLIDIGGGFPGNNKEMFEDIAQNVNEAIAQYFSGEEYKHVQFIAEPGRFFCQKSHTLVLNVIGKKVNIDNYGTKTFLYYLNDGLYGSFNCIYFDHYLPTVTPFYKKVVNTNTSSTMYSSTLFGPTCDSMDTIYDDVMLPELAIGDWVYVENFGAYTIAAASSFNGFQTCINKYVIRS